MMRGVNMITVMNGSYFYNDDMLNFEYYTDINVSAKKTDSTAERIKKLKASLKIRAKAAGILSKLITQVCQKPVYYR